MEPTEQAAAQKKLLREKYLDIRKALPEKDRARQDSAIQYQLLGSAMYQEASLLLAYVSYSTEVHTHGIIQKALDDGKRVAVPRCAADRQMFYYEITSFNDLKPGYMGILEPGPHLSFPLSASDMEGALCLVPGLAFDDQGFRIGYGGGYYDRFLAGFKGTKVALARPSQLSSEPIPTDQYDIPVDYVVAPNTIMAI